MGTFDNKHQPVPEINSYEGIDLGPYSADANDSAGQHSPKAVEVVTTRRHNVFRFWPWEIGSLIVALGMIAATYSTLSHFDGQKVPEWPFSINLNTLVALISTTMRAAMLVGVAEVISQTKWSWFSKPRPLMHLQYFDDASRSVSGSLSLLFIAPTSSLGILGAIITILSVGIGPFTQQAIKTVACLQTHEELDASLPLAHFVPGDNTYYRIGAGSYEVQVDMKGTMVNGIVNPTGNDSAIMATCPTGNCTFTPHGGITHSSIGMCSSCIDTTSLLSGPDGNFKNYTLPNKMWVAPAEDRAWLNVNNDNLTWASSLFTPEFALASGLSLINVTVLSITNATCLKDAGQCSESDRTGSPLGFVASSCSLYPCLKHYNATMERGVLSETIVSTQPAPANWVEAGIDPNGLDPYMNYTAVQTPCQVDDKWYNLSDISDVPKTDGRTFTPINIEGTNYTVPDECAYKMMLPYVMAMGTFMSQNLLRGTCTYNSRQGPAALYCSEKWWLSSLYKDKGATFDTLNEAFDQFATAVTNKLRTTGTSLYDPTTPETVKGLVQEMTVCTMFQWEWLLMPTFLTVATTAILTAMIIQNKRNRAQPVWKSSLLPLLYYGFDHKRRDHYDASKSTMNRTEMYQEASETKVIFRKDADAGFVDVTDRIGITDVVRRRTRDVDVDSLIDRG